MPRLSLLVVQLHDSRYFVGIVREIGRAQSELQSPDHLVCRLLLEKKKALMACIPLANPVHTLHFTPKRTFLCNPIRLPNSVYSFSCYSTPGNRCKSLWSNLAKND